MRIDFVCPNLQAGGAERHWSILVPGLQRLGLDVRVLTLDGRGPFYDALAQAGVPVATVADSGRLRNAAGLFRLVRDPAEVIVSRASSATVLAAIARATRRGTKWVVNWHHPTRMAIDPRRRMLQRQALPHADGVIAVSSSQIAELEALGVGRAAISVIPNGTDFVPDPGARESTRSALGLSHTDVAFLLVGRLERQKRVDRFIEAIARAGHAKPEIIGLVAGAGPDRSDLERQADESGARIHFLGRRDDIPAVLSAADALCLVSDHEALPFVVLEAMASQLPVIATPVGALPEVVVPGETGLLTDPADTGSLVEALLRLAGDRHQRVRFGHAGHQRQARLYAAEPMIDSYRETLANLV